MGRAHSTDALHLMVAGQGVVVGPPNADEILLLRTMYHLPRGINLGGYVLD
ncbi:MAG: hypothetical protein ACE5EO_04495 [Candidatus Krumholzibacteriia bacterium]